MENFLSPDFISIIVQGGAVGLSVLLILFLFYHANIGRKDRQDFTMTIKNHVVHEATIWSKLISVLDNNSKSLQRLSDSIDEMIRNLRK